VVLRSAGTEWTHPKKSWKVHVLSARLARSDRDCLHNCCDDPDEAFCFKGNQNVLITNDNTPLSCFEFDYS